MTQIRISLKMWVQRSLAELEPRSGIGDKHDDPCIGLSEDDKGRRGERSDNRMVLGGTS
jgi:hypothetical protein